MNRHLDLHLAPGAQCRLVLRTGMSPQTWSRSFVRTEISSIRPEQKLVAKQLHMPMNRHMDLHLAPGA